MSKLGIVLLSLVTVLAYGQESTEPTAPIKPRAYALVAAMGTHFNTVTETMSTGTHLSPYRHKSIEVPNNALNRITLHALDEAVEKIDPNSRRIYLSFAVPDMNGTRPADGLIARIASELKELPGRAEWDRILIATPAFRALEQDGIAGKVQGFGTFKEPLCQGGCGTLPGDFLGQDGVEATTSEGKTIRARTYIAPFAYVDIWVLDPKTLAVIDEKQGFESQKLANNPYYMGDIFMALDTTQKADVDFLLKRLNALIELSVDDAVTHSEVANRRGQVRVGPIREVAPDER